MTISIPAGTSLYPTDGPERRMYVADDSTAEIVDFDAWTGVYTVRFEDGEEYTVPCRELTAANGTFINIGNHVGSVNGNPVVDRYASQPGGTVDIVVVRLPDGTLEDRRL